MSYYFSAWSSYLDFSGRTSRIGFWAFMGVHLAISCGLVWLEVALDAWPIIELLYSLASFIPLLAITFRRLHDSQHSACWLAVILIPLFGWFVLLYLLLLPTNKSQQMPDNLGYTTHRNSSINLLDA